MVAGSPSAGLIRDHSPTSTSGVGVASSEGVADGDGNETSSVSVGGSGVSVGGKMAVAVGATLLAGTFIAYLGFYYNSTILGYRYVLAFAALFSFLAVIPFLMVRTSELSHSDEQRKFNIFKIKNKLTIIKVCTPEFLIGAGAGLFIPFVNLYFKDVLNAGPKDVANYMSIARFTMLIGFVIAPLVAKRLGLLRSVVATELLSIPFFAR